MIYKYTHLGYMLKVFAHGGVHGQKGLKVTVVAHRGRVEVREDKGF